MKKYIIRDREAGNVIDSFNTIEQAKAELSRYEQEDEREGTYTPDFYEIVEIDAKSEIYVSFHVGRGGRFHNPGHLTFIGEYDFQSLIAERSHKLTICDTIWDDSQNMEIILPDDEWKLVDSGSNVILEGRKAIEAKKGVLEFDTIYDKDYTITLDECDEKEWNALLNSYENAVERNYMSDDLQNEIKEYFDINEDDDENDDDE